VALFVPIVARIGETTRIGDRDHGWFQEEVEDEDTCEVGAEEDGGQKASE
jgi:hypothetical protein